MQQEQLTFPMSLVDAAKYFGVEYKNFKDRVMPNVMGIYEGLELPIPLRDPETRGLTEAGFEATRRYMSIVRSDDPEIRKTPSKYKQIEREAILSGNLPPEQIVESEQNQKQTEETAIVEVLPFPDAVGKQAEELQSDPGTYLMVAERTTIGASLNFQIDDLEFIVRKVDDSDITKNTQALEDASQRLAAGIAHVLTSTFVSELHEVREQQKNLVAGIKYQAVRQATEELGLGKPSGGGSSEAQS